MDLDPLSGIWREVRCRVRARSCVGEVGGCRGVQGGEVVLAPVEHLAGRRRQPDRSHEASASAGGAVRIHAGVDQSQVDVSASKILAGLVLAIIARGVAAQGQHERAASRQAVDRLAADRPHLVAVAVVGGRWRVRRRGIEVPAASGPSQRDRAHSTVLETTERHVVLAARAQRCERTRSALRSC